MESIKLCGGIISISAFFSCALLQSSFAYIRKGQVTEECKDYPSIINATRSTAHGNTFILPEKINKFLKSLDIYEAINPGFKTGCR